MRRLAVLVASAAVLMGVAAPAAFARSDDAAKPVVFIAGGENGAYTDCNALFGKLQKRLKAMDFEVADKKFKFTGAFTTLSNYDTDRNCDAVLSGGGAKGLEAQAKDLATWINSTYTAKGKTIDVVAQGTGGVVLRYALAMSAQKAPGWPALAVEDAVTLGAPHSGVADFTGKCGQRQICVELDTSTPAGKAMTEKLAKPEFQNPQGAGGTDWTAIAAIKDEVVPQASALGIDASHEATFLDDKLTHASMLADDAADYDAKVTYQHRGTDIVEWRKAPHLADRVGLNLVFGADGQYTTPTTTPAGCTGSNDTAGGAVIVRDPGLFDWKSSGDMSYVKSGILEAYANCFKKAKNADGDDVYVSDFTVRLNGLDVIPAPGTKVTIDPGKRHVTAPKMTLRIPSKWFGGTPITLWFDTKLDWYLPKEAGALTGDEGDGFKLSGSGKPPVLFKRKLKGSLKISVSQGAFNFEGTLALPGFFQGKVPAGGVPECGDGKDNDDDGFVDTNDDNCDSATDNYEDAADNPGIALAFKSTNVDGLIFDKITGTIEGNVKVGRFALPSVSFYLQPSENAFGGTVSAVIPWFTQPKVTVGVAIKDGKLAKFEAEGDGLGLLFYAPGQLYLQKAKFSVVPDPLEIMLGAAVSVGPRLPVAGNKSAAKIEVEGDITGNANGAKINAKLLLAGEEWGHGTVDIKGTGVTIVGGINKEKEVRKEYGTTKVRLKTYLNSDITGVIDGTGVDLSGKGSACFEGELKLKLYQREQEKTCVPEASLRGSLKKGLLAFTVCGQFDFGAISKSFGWGIRSASAGPGKPDDFKADVIAGSCDVDSWHTAPASASQAGGPPAVNVGKGLDTEVFGIEGDGGTPRVALRGPGGRVVPAPAEATGIVRGKDYAIIHSSADDTTYVIVASPEAGRWTVEPQPGSAAIATVRSADGLPDPSVKAHVTRVRGGKQRVTYQVRQIKGQTVRFREVGGGAIATIGTARGKRGSFAFTPKFGRGGKRKIVAIVEQRGMPRAELDVASFVAPAPRTLRAPRAVKLMRRGERLTVSWTRVTGAVRYIVDVQTGDGRAIHYEIKARRVVVKRMLGDAASTVTVRAVRTDEKLGKAKTVRGGKPRA